VVSANAVTKLPRFSSHLFHFLRPIVSVIAGNPGMNQNGVAIFL
jgi:hypothetical protein